MPWQNLTPILIWAVIAIPLFITLWIIHPTNKLALAVTWLAFTLVNIYFFMTVNWVLFNYYLRFVPLAFSIALGLHWQKPLRIHPVLPKRTAGEIGLLASGAVIGILAAILVVGNFQATQIGGDDAGSEGVVPLLALYPVRTGLYVIGNGGNGLKMGALNGFVRDWLGRPTNENDEMTYAVTIYEMRTNGMLANKIMDDDYRNYEIFGDTVYSPCIGRISAVVDGQKVNQPYTVTSGPGDRMGNRIVIQCTGINYFVTLANLHTITVQPGEEVSFNRMVGTVGNSASLSAPSILMYATTEDGKAAPVLFEAGYSFKFIYRNYVYVR